MTGRRFVLLIAMAIVVLDQITKALAVAFIDRNVEVFGSFFQLTLVRNPGAAFSFATSSTYLFTAVAAAAVVVMIKYAASITEKSWLVVWGLILGGASGNLMDRLFRSPGFPSGHVVDFLQLPHWPVFNVADSAISIAVVLGIATSFRKSS